MQLRRRGRATLLVAASVVLVACGGPVEVDVPDLSRADREACDAFAAELPDSLAEQDRVDIRPADAPAAAYGDPAIVVRCGVPTPEGFDLTASCETANGVGYFIPDEQYDDQGLDLTLTAAGYVPRVEIIIPAEYRPNAAPAVMSVLAPLIKDHFTLVDDCA
ncbi:MULTISPECIES: DUF3515 domain-containing protein [unclassified Nocardioides]|uniref:DUF3515 domain-containing protein n=1 Tax=unclassified Nocardioides TaxID=2615069 RepID=UPI0006F70FD9|nr:MULTISPECIES: DUF3515 domain-containing protein [unclassified Nocardioides]KRA29603.1 hypothetical protein ASD81_21790 [Nocardioides sp. Root614]KRA88222.1 hypothetical protein ASD84_19825 [Nocardioides sp. Root682]